MSRKWEGMPPREKNASLRTERAQRCRAAGYFSFAQVRQRLHVMEVAEAVADGIWLPEEEFLPQSAKSFYALKAWVRQLIASFMRFADLADRFYDGTMLREDILSSPGSTRRFLMGRLMRQQREVFLVIFLNNQHQVISKQKPRRCFAGTYNSVEVHPREIIRRALTLNAAAMIVAHNHPSGMPEPSRADRQLTKTD